MQFKVMFYNVWHGFHKEERNFDGSFDFEEERLRAAQTVVARERPNILALAEACFVRSDQLHRTLNYRELFNMECEFYAPSEGEWGSSVLSNFSIISGQNYRMHNRSFFKTRIAVGKRIVNFDFMHPHPSLSEEEKQRFVRASLRDMAAPYILAGDFNAISDEDCYDETKLFNGFSTFDTNAQETIGRLLQRLAIREVRKHGLIDTYRARNIDFDYTIPTNRRSLNKDSGIRIDYIFCSSDFRVKDARIIKCAETDIASDHYPVVAVLEM